MSDQEEAPRRLVPDEPFPPYAFVPGKSPHPTRDSVGHSYGRAHPSHSQLDPERWQHCRPYLRGIDLFNFGYYWEAHEAWENIWHAAGRRGEVAEFLKGLIALAAAGVKAREGKAAGVRQHARRAQMIFRSLIHQPKRMGLDVADLDKEAAHLADSAESVVNTASVPVAVVFPFGLAISHRHPRTRN